MKNGLLDLDFINTCDFSDKSVIRFSEDFQEDIRGLIRTFNLYIRLPEKYYAEIKIAEKNNKAGNITLRKLFNLLTRKP